MNNSSGQTVSSWSATAEIPGQQPLSADEKVDVCVVGGGISGLTTAYLLAKEGKSVVVLEKGETAGGETCRTTAHLASAIDDRIFELEKWHGLEGARLAVESHAAAIDKIESIAAAERIDCDFARVDGYLFAAPGDPPDLLDRELAAAQRAGMEVLKLSRAPIEDYDTGPALRFGQQGQFHVLKYLSKVADALRAAGGRIFNHTHVTQIESGPPAKIQTKTGGTVTAGFLVLATNSPITDHYVMMTKLAPYRTYAIAAAVPKGLIPRALLWDTADPYHYIRTQAWEGPGAMTDSGVEADLLIIGGEDHKTGQAADMDDRYAKLEAWARERWPMMDGVKFRWSGQVAETPDGLAYIGPNPSDQPNVFIAAGDSGHGMTHGTLAGMILTDLILGRKNPWAALYSPTRKPIKSAGDWVRENANVAAQYTKWLSGGDVSSADEIPPGEGAILRRGLKKIAVFKDDGGAVSECSATCPHMDCIVAWNPGEKSWDCPCHGSRFGPTGKVLTGPAFSDLAPVDHKPEEVHAGWKDASGEK